MRNKTLFTLDTGWKTPAPEEVQFVKNFCKVKGIATESGSGLFSFPRSFELIIIPTKRFPELRDALTNINNEMIILSIDANLNATQIDLCFNTEQNIGKIRAVTQKEAEDTYKYFTHNGNWYVFEN